MSEESEEGKEETKVLAKCLNCSSVLEDRFCSHCGQDSKEFKRSVWNVFVRFFETFTDFDNKLWSSLFPLIFKPGFLTRQFLAGKRKSYLNPIQMYAFFSFLYFFTFFYMPDFVSVDKSSLAERLTKEMSDSNSLETDLNDTIPFGSIGNSKITIKRDAKQKDKITINQGSLQTLKSYDSSQLSHPKSKRHGFIVRSIYRKTLDVLEKSRNKDSTALASLIETFKANSANLIILLLPLFALILKILYIRRSFYYVEHLIFSIHFHCFAFLILSIGNILFSCIAMPDEFEVYLFLGVFIYFFIAMKKMYGQSWKLTFLKFNLWGASYTVLLVLGLMLNLLVSAILS